MKNAAFILAVTITLFAACASKPKSPGTAISSPAANANTTSSFDGFWELPNGQLHVFKKNAFILMDNEGVKVDTGLFTFTNTQLYLNLEKNFFVQFDYVFESGNLRVSGSGNEWAHGIWKKINYNDSSDNPLVGYWEYISEEEIRILHILPFGWGIWYTCDLSYNLVSKSEIRYENNNTSEFRSVVNGDYSPISFPVSFKFDGADLIVAGNRYVRR